VHPRLQAVDHGIALVKQCLTVAMASLVQLPITISNNDGSEEWRVMIGVRLASHTLHDAKVALHTRDSRAPLPNKQIWRFVTATGDRKTNSTSVILDNDHAILSSYGITNTSTIMVDRAHDTAILPFVLPSITIADYSLPLNELLQAAVATLRVDGL
jgi:hypothetical protein